jgi:hypothetical protein
MSESAKRRGSLQRGRGWRQWKEPEARSALSAWRRSGLSAAAFCAREGYSEARLWYWRKRLGAQPAEQSPTVSFVRVPLEGAARGGQIEIECSGVVLRVREGLDVEHVARLVAALVAVGQTC